MVIKEYIIKDTNKRLLKRKTIAQSCCSILKDNQFHDISISKLAKTAGIGKGTIYEYFTSKEDIVFELMSCMQETYDKKLQKSLMSIHNNMDKVFAIFDIFISHDKLIITQREIYKQFLIVCLSKPNEKVKQYNANIRCKYISILKSIIDNQSISEQMFDDIVGIFVVSNTLNNYDLSSNVQKYIKKQINLINKFEEN